MDTRKRSLLGGVFLGGVNCDLFTVDDHLPSPGETTVGGTFGWSAGGKVGNAAGMFAQLLRVYEQECPWSALVTRVGGQDSPLLQFGQVALQAYQAAGVDTAYALVDAGAKTTIAMIMSALKPANNIIRVPADATARMDASDADRAAEAIAAARVLVLAREIPWTAMVRATEISHQARTVVIFNAAPAPTDGVVPDALRQNVDFLLVNSVEASAMARMTVRNQSTAIQATRILQQQGWKNVIITLGKNGVVALFAGQSNPITSRAFRLKKKQIADTTAAGDAFCGAMAAYLTVWLFKGMSLADIDYTDLLKFASAAAAHCIKHAGALSSIVAVCLEDVEKLSGVQLPRNLTPAHQ